MNKQIVGHRKLTLDIIFGYDPYVDKLANIIRKYNKRTTPLQWRTFKYNNTISNTDISNLYRNEIFSKYHIWRIVTKGLLLCHRCAMMNTNIIFYHDDFALPAPCRWCKTEVFNQYYCSLRGFCKYIPQILEH